MNRVTRIRELIKWQHNNIKKLQAQDLTKGARESIIEAIEDINSRLESLGYKGQYLTVDHK